MLVPRHGHSVRVPACMVFAAAGVSPKTVSLGKSPGTELYICLCRCATDRCAASQVGVSQEYLLNGLV